MGGACTKASRRRSTARSRDRDRKEKEEETVGPNPFKDKDKANPARSETVKERYELYKDGESSEVTQEQLSRMSSSNNLKRISSSASMGSQQGGGQNGVDNGMSSSGILRRMTSSPSFRQKTGSEQMGNSGLEASQKSLGNPNDFGSGEVQDDPMEELQGRFVVFVDNRDTESQRVSRCGSPMSSPRGSIRSPRSPTNPNESPGAEFAKSPFEGGLHTSFGVVELPPALTPETSNLAMGEDTENVIKLMPELEGESEGLRAQAGKRKPKRRKSGFKKISDAELFEDWGLPPQADESTNGKADGGNGDNISPESPSLPSPPKRDAVPEADPDDESESTASGSPVSPKRDVADAFPASSGTHPNVPPLWDPTIA